MYRKLLDAGLLSAKVTVTREIGTVSVLQSPGLSFHPSLFIWLLEEEAIQIEIPWGNVLLGYQWPLSTSMTSLHQEPFSDVARNSGVLQRTTIGLIFFNIFIGVYGIIF